MKFEKAFDYESGKCEKCGYSFEVRHDVDWSKERKFKKTAFILFSSSILVLLLDALIDALLGTSLSFELLGGLGVCAAGAYFFIGMIAIMKESRQVITHD